MVMVLSGATEPSGEGLLATVSIALTDVNGKKVQGYYEGDAIVGETVLQTDINGEWSYNLIPNELILPENTVYTATYTQKKGNKTYTWFNRFWVPDEFGPIVAAEFLVEGIDEVQAAALQLHVADTKKHGAALPVPLTFSQPGNAVTGASGALRIPATGTLTRAVLTVTSAPIGSDLSVNILRNGTSFRNLTITDGNNAPRIATLSEPVSDGDFLTVETVTVGTDSPAQNIVVQIDLMQ